jgi:iron complex transport system ATP-binding protein
MCTESKLSGLCGLSMRRLDYRSGESQTSSIVANYASIDR